MKVPKTFIPDKDLENKVYNLKEESYRIICHKDEELAKLSTKEIFEKSRYLAQECGHFRLKLVFKSKQNSLIIKYTPHLPPWTSTERIKMYLNKGFFKKEKVFEYFIDYSQCYGDKLLKYAPGNWENDLEKLYKKHANESP